MLVDSLLEPFPAAVAAAIEGELSRAGYTLVIATTQGAAEKAERCTSEMLGRGVEALLSWNVAATPALVERAAAQSVPWLAFDNSDKTAASARLASGRPSGAALACRYLLSLGHQRVAVVAAEGARALREALAGIGVMLETESVANGADVDGAQAALRALLGRATPPTAIFCGNDLLAMAVLRESQVHGALVPQELSVMGFGDSPLARCAAPPLSSVRVSPQEIATRAIEALLLRLDGGTPFPADLSLKLVIRDSTGPASARS